jgi:5'-3' exonuclease
MGLKYLIIDMSNIMYRAFHVNIREDEDILLGMCHSSAIISMNYLFKKYKCDEIVAVFDSSSWRKVYTKDDSISHKKYKANRRKNLTDRQKEQFKVFDEHIIQFYEYLKNYTSLIVLKHNLLECDDIVAAFVDSHPDDEHILISTDKDFIQLLDNDNLKLIDPSTEKERTLKEWNYDAKYFMFVKCFRGDVGDNVQSSYPRLTKTKILEAYNDSFKFLNLLEHEFKVDHFDKYGNLCEVNYKTKDLFYEGELLMDLRKQPDFIKKICKIAIYEGINNRSEFDLFEFIKFCNKYQLIRILNDKMTYARMLSHHVVA